MQEKLLQFGHCQNGEESKPQSKFFEQLLDNFFSVSVKNLPGGRRGGGGWVNKI